MAHQNFISSGYLLILTGIIVGFSALAAGENGIDIDVERMNDADSGVVSLSENGSYSRLLETEKIVHAHFHAD